MAFLFGWDELRMGWMVVESFLGEICANTGGLAFEGVAHPYKENIIKFGGMPRIAELPEVKATLAQAPKGAGVEAER